MSGSLLVPVLSGKTESEAINHVVFESSLLRIGLWRCRPWHDLFRRDREAQGHYIVFPRSSVYITPSGRSRIVADPNVVMFYNKHQTYQREKLSDVGDICEYFGFDDSALLEMMQQHTPGLLGKPESPFPVTHGPSDPQSYLLQRMVVEHVLALGQPDPLFVEETVLHVLARVMGNSMPLNERHRAQTAVTRRVHAEIAEATRSLLARRYQESLKLDDLAGQLHTSSYHLCRVFKSETGQTIHQYRNDIRLRSALDYVLQSDIDFTTLGLSLGYASHSHFTQAFRLRFGYTPSDLRRRRTLSRLRELRQRVGLAV